MTALTPKLIEAIADSIRRGLPLRTTLTLLDIPPKTFQQWLQLAETQTYANGIRVNRATHELHVALVSAVQRARAEHEAELVAAVANYESPKGDKDWRARAWLLSHGPSRQEWYEHRSSSTEQTITVHHAHQVVRQLSDEELLALPAPHEGTRTYTRTREDASEKSAFSEP